MAYIGKSPSGTGVRQRYYFTATGGETSLSGTDDNGLTLSYSDGAYVDVLLNGIELVAGTDYNTSTANTIAGLAALAASDVVTVTVYDIFTVADTVSAKDGGTFSGNVGLAGNDLILDADADSKIEASTDDTINIISGGTTGLTIDSSGHVIKPANPTFIVYATGSGWTNLTAGTEYTVPWNVERLDTGNNFNTTTYQWTAPIDCVMMFGTQMYMDAASANYTRLRLYENTTLIHEHITDAPEATIPEGASQSSVLFDVTAGRTYQWKLLKNGTTPQIYLHATGSLEFTYCWGYMVG